MPEHTEIRMDSREAFGDDLGAILAAEEHRQDRPYIAGDHCALCAEVDWAWAQATCEHGDVVEMTELCDPYRRDLCNDCGTEVRRDDTAEDH